MGPQKFRQKIVCEVAHLHSTRRVFNSRRGQLRTQKASKLLAAGDPTGGVCIAPQAQEHALPKAPPRSQHFGLPASALGAETTEGPQVTVEPAPISHCLCLCLSQVGVLSKPLNESRCVLAWELPSTYPIHCVIRKFTYAFRNKGASV